MAEKRSLLRRLLWGDEPRRFSLSDYLTQTGFTYDGNWYPLGLSTTLGNTKQEPPEASFTGYAGLLHSNPIIFACMETRRLIFSEARFQYQQLRNGRPGDLFGTTELEILERPWVNATTGDLLSRAITDVDLAGNFFCARDGQKLMHMRPDWTSIVLGSNMEPDSPALALDAEVIGYLYHPGGYASGVKPVALLPEQVCHWAPRIDPLARFRGMSWLTPVIRELLADAAMTEHRQKFFENGATVNGVVTYPPELNMQQFQEHIEAFRRGQEGVANAYRTIFLGGGSTYMPIGSNMEQVDFKIVQGSGETRIAAAARVPPIMVGLSEGLSAATYSNYGQARRAFADLTMRPLWRDFSGSLESVVVVPRNAQLWYDDRHIPFLQEDMKDEADIQATIAQTIRTLLDAGYEGASVIAAATSGDFSLLEHTGLFSVQLQPAGTTTPESPNGQVALPIGADV